MKNNQSGRDFFKEVKQAYLDLNAKNPSLDLPILSPNSNLRLETYIDAKTTTYQFPMMDGDAGKGANSKILANEVRLSKNDNFHVNQIGFYLAVTETKDDTDYRLLTNPNEIYLGSAAAALSYENLWAGLLNINVNKGDVLQKHRLSQYMFVGQTQRLSATVNTNFDQIDFSENGLIPLDAYFMISGAYTNTITINLNNAIEEALEESNSRIVLIFDGILASNAAVTLGSIKG